MAKDQPKHSAPVAPAATFRDEPKAPEAPKAEANAPAEKAPVPKAPAKAVGPMQKVKALSGLLHEGMFYSGGEVLQLTVAEAERREKRGEIELID